jgi:hypothetical protein
MMRETVEFRVVADYFSRLFEPHEGKLLGVGKLLDAGIYAIEVSTNDPRFNEAGRLDKEIKETDGRSFFSGCPRNGGPSSAARRPGGAVSERWLEAMVDEESRCCML